MWWENNLPSFMESFGSSMAKGVNVTSEFLSNCLKTYVFMYEKKVITPLLLQTVVATFGAILLGYFCGKLFFSKYDAKQLNNKNMSNKKLSTSKVKRKHHKTRSNRKSERLEKSETDSDTNIEKAKHVADGSDSCETYSGDEVGAEDIILDPNDINYVEDGGAPIEDMNTDFIVQNIQAKVKAAESRSLWNKISKDMSEDDKKAEQEAQRKQLENIFAMMESQKEKFGVDGVSDVEQQMKLYM